ncbi:aspartate aminotransferase family protein [Bacillus safensis]|uniref:class-III pyridoxal-phosphate-dependent aminotransferase n=1 Tax=Bacillus safensis TaxID=561879 RepID=UPI0022816B7C|nr:aspartate aminotransferase family protein [Bacillus safensis]MCY7493663.1 aspartate aminotransferase family protein [Bacillus safensis]MED4993106.1 aspartate aminotransferase family protein [Bacillus safensis]
MSQADWKKVEEWDKKYILRTFSTQEEYQPIPIESTEGDYLIMPDGTRLLDCFNQLYCVNVGQKNEKVNQAIKEALDRYGFLQDAYTTDYKAKAAKLIIEDILGNEDWAGKVRFVSTGSEAVETALMIARLYKNRQLVVTREYAYHGFTKGSTSVTRLKGSRSGITETNPSSLPQGMPGQDNGLVAVAPSPNCIRCSLGHQYGSCHDENGELACVKYTRRMIENQGREQVAAIITEVTQGAGSVQPPDEYIPQIRQMTKELDILWIADEVLTGFGRTGEWFAYQHYGVQPDIVSMAKGISSSAIPAGAVVVNKEIAEFMDQYRWETVSTYSGHPIAMAAVCANIEHIMEENLVDKSRKAGHYIQQKLIELKSKHFSIGQVAGYGVLWIVELVKDDKMRPLVEIDRNFTHEVDPSTFPTNIIREKAIEKGVLIGGVMPNTLRIGLSLNVSKEDIDKAMDALDFALTHFESKVLQAN